MTFALHVILSKFESAISLLYKFSQRPFSLISQLIFANWINVLGNQDVRHFLGKNIYSTLRFPANHMGNLISFFPAPIPILLNFQLRYRNVTLLCNLVISHCNRRGRHQEKTIFANMTTFFRKHDKNIDFSVCIIKKLPWLVSSQGKVPDMD